MWRAANLGMGWPGAFASAFDAVRELCPVVVPLDLAVHDRALALAERHGFSTYDAMIVSAAIAAGCEVLYSEDPSHGQAIDGLKIANPFPEGLIPKLDSRWTIAASWRTINALTL